MENMENTNIENTGAVNAEAEKKKQNKLFNLVFAAIVIVVVVVVIINRLNIVKPQVTIDDETLSVGMTVEKLVDAGFTVGLSMTGSGDLDLDSQPKVPGEKYSSTPYYIFKDGEYTNVTFSVYNRSVNACEFEKSRIYAFSYSARFNFSGTEVLINDIEIGGMDVDDAIEELEDLGVKFDDDKKEEFLDGDYGFIIGNSGDYSFEINADDAGEVIESIRVKLKV